MTSFDFRPRTRILFGAGEFARLGEVAREQNATRCLLIAGQNSVDSGHAPEAVRSLKARRMDVFAFHDFTANPTVAMVEAARDYAGPQAVNLVVGLGDGDGARFREAGQRAALKRRFDCAITAATAMFLSRCCP